MVDEVEGQAQMGPKSRRMGWLDLPICFLNFVASTLHSAADIASDTTFIVACHANYLRDQREFKEIVKHYDDPSFGPRVPEPTD